MSDGTPPIALVCLGRGKSAYFLVSHIQPDIPILVATQHPVDTDKIRGLNGEDHPYAQVDSINTILQFLEQHPDRQAVFTVTTYPARGKEWLDMLFSPSTKNLYDSIKPRPIFFLPQSPNPYIGAFAAVGTVIIADYFQGIGSAEHDLSSRISHGKFGVKEVTRFSIVGGDKISRQQAERIIPLLTLSQKTVKHETPLELALLPTNALLHTAGIAAHIAGALVQKGRLSPNIMQAKTTQEFFEPLNALGLDGGALIAALGYSLKGRGFYREMPPVGPDIIMHEMSQAALKVRAVLIDRKLMPRSDLDDAGGAHIFHHLREKYALQFKESRKQDAHEVPFSEFVNTNPPYQNRMIAFPTDPSGEINIEHRFFHEELPTLTALLQLSEALKLSKNDLEPTRFVTDFNQTLCGKRYIKADGTLGEDAPAYLRELRTPTQFADFLNGAGKGQVVSF